MFAMVGILLNVDAAFGCGTREMQAETVMKSDLRNLIGAQEAFLAKHQRYARSLDESGYHKSSGVTAITIEAIGARGFSATATHAKTTMVCRIYVGLRPSGFDAGQVEGERRCEGGSGPYMIGSDLYVSFWVLMLGLTLTSFFRLRRPGGADWPAHALVVLTSLYGARIVLNSGCGLLPIEEVGFVVLLSLGVFTFALWRHRRVPAVSRS